MLKKQRREKCGTVIKFSKQICECSKLIFQILVYYYYYKLFYTGISWVLIANHYQEASNELESKQMVLS